MCHIPDLGTQAVLWTYGHLPWEASQRDYGVALSEAGGGPTLMELLVSHSGFLPLPIKNLA